MTKFSRLKRLKKHGFNPIHIVGDLYFIRKRSKNSKKWSVYEIRKLSD